MKCPHCLEHFTPVFKYEKLTFDRLGYWQIKHTKCANEQCERLIVYLIFNKETKRQPTGLVVPVGEAEATLILPKTTGRVTIPPEVPDDLKQNYLEACLVLADSPKASAALSRRCLQYLLREYANVKKDTLYNEIQEVIDKGDLSSELADDIDSIRKIGNFAAHPEKSEKTGEIVPVEAGEAEWNLDILEELFDHYFVKPAKKKKRRDSLNKKLAEMGKKEIKNPKKI